MYKPGNIKEGKQKYIISVYRFGLVMYCHSSDLVIITEGMYQFRNILISFCDSFQLVF